MKSFILTLFFCELINFFSPTSTTIITVPFLEAAIQFVSTSIKGVQVSVGLTGEFQ